MSDTKGLGLLSSAVAHGSGDDDSDEDDEDYVPSADEGGEGDSEDDGDEEEEEADTNSLADKHTSIPESSVADKAKADALWSSFLSDVEPRSKPKQPTKKSNPSTAASPSTTVSRTADTSNKSTTAPKNSDLATGSTTCKTTSMTSKSATQDQAATEAGKDIDSLPQKRKGGLNAVLGFINKKQKVSTLDKSKLDWEKYKKEAGISHELRAHTTSNNSYLEKKEFLERADQRQYEHERKHKQSSLNKRR